MRDRYLPDEFERGWRERWAEAELFKASEATDKPKFYGLEFFPYPSGAGLSVGHCRNYIPTDVICRKRAMQGYNVLHPMGFDAFGLPAENEAIKRKTAPGPMIDQYAATYRRQMDLVGNGYDWSRTFKSSEPSYYKWTQWIFARLYEKGLAFRSNADVNWCPKDKTALANEEVVGGLCERCGTPVERRAIPQWYFRITDYAQRLIDDLDTVQWPEGIKAMQRNWIGRSEGVEFEMKVAPMGGGEGSEAAEGFEVKQPQLSFRVFTTRIDTIFGMTFCVLAPEHPLVASLLKLVDAAAADKVRAYQAEARALSDMDRQATTREKTGIFTGAHAINPATGKPVPIFVADYVLMGYGTGAIMAVPGHDQRDFDFAIKFGLDVVGVIEPDDAYLRRNVMLENFDRAQALLKYAAEIKSFKEVFESKDGTLMNSGEYTGQSVAKAQPTLGEWIEALGIGTRKINYKLRDWLISRQRYWGCPIPIVHTKEGEEQLVPDDCLPVYLPEVEHYEPSDDGSSPLSRIPDFVNTTDRDGTLGRRETDTMGGFACSSWYFLRFADPRNENAPWDKAKADYWLPVDIYVGGAEHAVMHLLYARFWTKVFYDLGLVSFTEPFQRLENQGQVLGKTPYRAARADENLGVGEDGVLISFEEAAAMSEEELTWRWVRMSKSKGNVVTPDQAVSEYGADALRIYELFVAPFDADVQWNNEGMQGASRFLSRVFKWVSDQSAHFTTDWKTHIGLAPNDSVGAKIRRITHKTIAKVSDDIEKFAFNTAVSAMMVYSNELADLTRDLTAPNDTQKLAISEAIETMILLLAPMAPHSSDEMWESLGQIGFTYNSPWPEAVAELAVDDTVTIAVQVNGKLRDTLEMPAVADQAAMEAAALASEKVAVHLDGKTVRKVVVVPGKLVNIVAN